MFQTMKKLLKNAEDPHLAVLSYCATPHPWWKLIINGTTHTYVHWCQYQMITLFPLGHIFQDSINSQFREKQKLDFDCHHGVHSLPPISNDTDVWINLDDGRQILGKIVSIAQSPRSYVVQTSSGQFVGTEVILRLCLFPWPRMTDNYVKVNPLE